MDPKDNVFKRIAGLFLHPRKTIGEIAGDPTGWKWIFALLVGILLMFSLYLIQMPSALNSILVIASTFSLQIIVLLYVVVMVVVAVIFFIFLFLVHFIGTQLRRTRTRHRSRKVVFNLYIYSLSPFLLLLSQIPFILIFGGYYSLFNLKLFYFFLLGIVFGWHFLLFYQGFQVNAEISPRWSKLITGLYIGSLGTITGILIYATLYINFDISWLGALGL